MQKETLRYLRSVPGFWYMATPYSKFYAGREAAHAQACSVAGCLTRHGVTVYSPIAHSHEIAKSAAIDTDAAAWAEPNRTMLASAGGLIVVTMHGWLESVGVLAEIGYAKWLELPTVILAPAEVRGAVR
ncbi:hypothetical protein ATO13_23391 [Stappia sp. 22II-S9-Z10]|nr:hypothetical protein ATO13_23391 [Stappia sp. 22II-S9-Z10]